MLPQGQNLFLNLLLKVLFPLKVRNDLAKSVCSAAGQLGRGKPGPTLQSLL